MSRSAVYFDNAATTRVDPRVVDAMLPFFSSDYGNAASRAHSFGWAAEEAVTEARRAIAETLNADEREIVFTSGATEANNLALKGVLDAYADRGDHLITVATEHPSVADSAPSLARKGKRITLLGVDTVGQIDLAELSDAITDRTVLVSVMAANNETGVLQDIAAIGALCRSRSVLFHTDATQALGKVALDVAAAHIDLMSVSAHKIYGPKGIGALYVRREPRVRIAAQMDGGGHERNMRSGTLNVPGIVGFGTACRLCVDELAAAHRDLRTLRDHLTSRLLEDCPGARLNGHRAARVPGIVNIAFPGTDGGQLLKVLNERGIAVSSGSACSSTSLEPSRVLRALGLSEADARSSLRFSLGRFNTRDEVELVIAAVTEIVTRGELL